MAFVKSIPFKDLIFLQERMGRAFDEALDRYRGWDESSEGVWSPPADIYETEDMLVIKVEIPGVRDDEVKVEVNKNILTLKGERKLEKNLSEEHCHRMECSYGVFQRSFNLTGAIDENKIKASFSDGVLEIRAPKAKESRQKQIKVEIK